MLIQTAFRGDKSFIEISEPCEYEDFVAAVAEEFQIGNTAGLVASVNGTRIKRTQFKAVVLQYFNVPTFHIDITVKAPEHSTASVSTVSSPHNTNQSLPDSEPSRELLATGPLIVELTIPDAERIKSLKVVKQILHEYSLGKPLQNKHRVKIAKAIIDECLNDFPDRILYREDFYALAQFIVSIFDTEVVSAYYLPSVKGAHARGKLWNAYNNKRTALSSSGLISRRSKINLKRKRSTSPSSTADTVLESVQYLQRTNSDWATVSDKWYETHSYRMDQLKSSITTYDYLKKYPALHEKLGIELAAMDVNCLYPSAATIENWFILYPKVLTQARTLRDKYVGQVIDKIDDSPDERFKAQLTLLLVPYILPHCGKRSEYTGGNATKSEIQQRFIKEYKSISEIEEEEDPADVQIRFVKHNDVVTYAEFSIAGYTINCQDLMEAVNIGFMYIMALNVKYPKLCTHVWQFIQLAIFQIPLTDNKVANVETLINDLFKDVQELREV